MQDTHAAVTAELRFERDSAGDRLALATTELAEESAR